jgi:hypothetical protein
VQLSVVLLEQRNGTPFSSKRFIPYATPDAESTSFMVSPCTQ